MITRIDKTFRTSFVIGLSCAAALAVSSACVLCAEPPVGASRGRGKLPALGRHEKIRFFFTQWWHFRNGGVSDEELMAGLAKVGASVFADLGYNEKRAELAHANGIRYFGGFATARLRGPAEKLKSRLADHHRLVAVTADRLTAELRTTVLCVRSGPVRAFFADRLIPVPTSREEHYERSRTTSSCVVPRALLGESPLWCCVVWTGA